VKISTTFDRGFLISTRHIPNGRACGDAEDFQKPKLFFEMRHGKSLSGYIFQLLYGIEQAGATMQKPPVVCTGRRGFVQGKS
jgi:hypothetical protein